MARKKKTEVTENKTTSKKKTLKAPEPSKTHKKGDIVYIPFKDLPGRVLGKVYEVFHEDYEPCMMRLVYIGEISKLIVE